MKTPIALFVFNRPDLTRLLAHKVAEAQPSKLFIVADGPRKGVPGDVEQCAAARAVLETISWDCEVFRNYSDTNIGCKKRVSSGIDWVFGHVEEAVILEDDCMPDPSFFYFCDELLERYRDDERIMMITGNDFHRGSERRAYSYYFTRNPHMWGWATWRRAWQLFDVDMKIWPDLRETSLMADVLQDDSLVEQTRAEFDGTFDGRIEAWDYQWLFALWAHHGLAIAPETNLVSNVGFRSDATHTWSTEDRRAAMPTQPIKFPMRHPPYMVEEKTFRRSAHRSRLLRRSGNSRVFRRLVRQIKGRLLS